MKFEQWIAAGLVALTLSACAASVCAAEETVVASRDLADMSLEELMGIEVYSAAKKKQRLSDSAAAAYVLTNEDIRRSGVTTIPEALRLVPGVEVARITSNTWAITIRGFNERFANKLLVLIDGRSVYTPLFAGVYWDIQDVVLEDIDRIEVIRGPGGTLWGANAVNGVINIITKKASETQGALLSAGAGTEEEAFGTARYGGKIGNNAYARVYGKYFQRDDFKGTSTGRDDASDEWHMSHGGFRMDWDPKETDTFTLQGDLYDGKFGSFSTNAAPPPTFVESGTEHPEAYGGNLLGRWTHRFAGGSEAQFQAYYDRTDRDSRPPTINEDRDTADIDFQHRLKVWGRHDVVWGLGYRSTWDHIPGSFSLSFDPEERTDNLFSAFVQDEIGFLDDSLRLTLGIKLEHNDYTGFEYQPNARLLWKPDERHTVWAAVSRAVRTPSRAEDDIRIIANVIPAGTPGTPCALSPLPCFIAFNGNSGFDAEELIAFELGYRQQVRDNVGLDVTAFYNIYNDLRTVVPGTPGFEDNPPTHVLIPIVVGNGLEADTWGFEVAADWRPVDFWTLRSGYSFLEMDLDFDNDAQTDPVSGFADGSSPQNQVFVHSMLDLPYHFEFDSTVRWVDQLKSLGIGDYASLDLRLAWHATEHVELALVGQNLLSTANQEFASSQFVNDEPTRVQRGVYGKVTIEF
jgi:iron complex outermembrane receptor protein